MHRRTMLFTLIGAVVMIAGCVAPGTGEDPANTAEGDTEEPFKLAFSVKDDFDQFVDDTQPLADELSEATQREVEIVPVQDESAATAAVATGDATAAFLDGGAAWVAWQQLGLEAIAADAKADGRTYYVAAAWVHADSPYETMADLEGARSCHTSELGSSGTLMPMGYLFENGLIDTSELPDDLTALQQAREQYFEDPVVGGGYQGAFQCLSDERGDVAFVRDTTWEEYCQPDDAPDWCLDRDEYRVLETFARVPSHPVMVNPDLPLEDRALLKYGLLSLNDGDGQTVLEDVLNTPAIKHVDTEGHLGGYGDLVENIPGIQDYFEEKTWT